MIYDDLCMISWTMDLLPCVRGRIGYYRMGQSKLQEQDCTQVTQRGCVTSGFSGFTPQTENWLMVTAWKFSRNMKGPGAALEAQKQALHSGLFFTCHHGYPETSCSGKKVQPKGPGEFSIVPSRGPSSTERMQDNRQSRIPVKWTSSIGFVAICLLSWCFGTHSEAYLKPFEFWVPLLVQQRPDQFYIRSIF